MTTKTKIAVVEDHKLVRKGLVSMVESFEDYDIIIEAQNGHEFIEKLDPSNLPALVMMDVNMPEMDGYSTASWVARHFPGIKILALSMYDSETAIIRMFKSGARGYLFKYCDPQDVKAALNGIINDGYYFAETNTGRLIHTINFEDLAFNYATLSPIEKLSDREMEFLQFACTEMTYKEIAGAMYLSPRTIDGYRDALFEKLHLKTRVGLVTFAIKHGIVNV
jgi:two-component system, NarL family, invasion response regulator UvrY